ncbi:dTDP-4-dehydrorhamnose reductase [Porticoccus sp.]
MKFLITGGEGQLGRCLVDCLSKTDHEFVALGKGELDITDAQAVMAVVEGCHPDVIINAAAYTAVDRAETEPDLAWRINGEAVAHLAAAANAVGALLVQVSTDYVFDGQSSRPYLETDPVNPSSVYGVSKRAGEKQTEKANHFLIVRTAWVFSEYGNNFVKTMLRLGAESEVLSIVADQRGTPTYAGDLAYALIKMSEAGLSAGIYHFSGGKSCSWFEFATAIFQAAHTVLPKFRVPKLVPITAAAYPTPASRPMYSVMDDSKLKDACPACLSDWQIALDIVVSRLGVA